MLHLSSYSSDRETGEDGRILAFAKEIGETLGIPASNFRRIRWVKYVQSDGCAFRSGSLGLSSRMKEKLDPSDWKPLLASHFIYKKTRRKRLLPTALKDAAIYVVIFFVGIILVARVLGQNGGLVALGYSILSFFLFSINRSTQDTKKRKLKADIEASKTVGKEKFLLLLRKIDSFRMEDVEKAKKKTILSYFTSRPSITVRINNLSSAKDSSLTLQG